MPKSHALGLLLLRLSFGLVLAAHGARHLASYHAFVHLAGGRWQAIGAIAGELGGGLGLATGLLTRLAGLGLGVVMLTIAFTRMFHGLAAIGTGPGVGFEFPFLVGILGVALVFTGAGEWSLDGALFRRKKGKAR